MDTRAKRIAEALLATALLVCAQVVGLLSCASTPAFAATGSDPMTVTLDGGNQTSRHALDGIEAYCCNSYLSSPPKGTVLNHWKSGPLALDYVLYHSDGGPSNSSPHYSWTITKWVVWAILEGDLSELDYYADGVTPNPNRATNHKLYNEAMAFQSSGGNGPERGCSRIYDPPSSSYQPLCVCVPMVGDVELTKCSSLGQLSDGDACYDLSGAEYTVYQDSACSRPVGKLVTDSAGKAQLKSLSRGTYWVRETKAPRGFAKDTNTYEIQVNPSKVAVVNGSIVADKPVFAQMETLVRKGDSELAKLGMDNAAQGDAALAGAQFTVMRYANTNGTHSGSPDRTWTIATGANGTARLDDEHLVSGDELYRDAQGKSVLPLGTYVLQETSAPEGYLLQDPVTCVFVVIQEGDAAVVKELEGPKADGSRFLVLDDVIRGGVSLGKVDAQRGDHVPEGAASLEGAVIAIKLESDQPVIVNGTTYLTGSTVATLTMDATGTASTSADLLPYGSYRAVEIEAPKGYLLTREGAWSRPFTIREQGVVVDLSDEASSVPDQVKRGDLEFVKVDGRTMGRLAGIPFAIESLTTGERHVVVTDENGYCSTSSAFIPHSEGTNVNDTLLLGMAAQVEEAMSAELPDLEAATDAPDKTEAEPAEDELTDDETEQATEEVATEDAPQDEELVAEGVAGTDSPKEHAETEGRADVPDDAEEAGTTAEPQGEQAVEEIPADLVAQAELVQEDETHTASGVWFSGGTDKEVPVNDLLGALPYDTYQITELRCAANAGYELLDFQIVVSRDNYVIDVGTLDDQALPTIQTELATVGTSEGTDLWQLVDTVFFGDVRADGSEYELRGTLHLVGEDGSDLGVLTDARGNAATSTTTFCPKMSNGTVEVPFEVDVSQVRGRTIVAFEELWRDGELLASHCDISDSDQSVSIPSIGTTLTDAEGAKETCGADAVTLVDHVSYEGLVPGKTYRVTGELMDKQTGEAILDGDGNPLHAETTFSPEEPSGSVDVTFVFEGTPCLGKTVVAFESLWQDDLELAVHAVIDDEEQSVLIPKVLTNAADAKDGDHEVLADKAARIVDTVTYEGLVPGEEYLLSGKLVRRGTAEPVLVGGEPVVAEVSFVPDGPDGEIEALFELDARELAGSEFTVFETLSHGGKVVARHEDPSSEAQSVRIPKIGTTAQSKDGKKAIEAAKEQQVIDSVAYVGLTPGREYIASGVLHLRDANGKDLGPLKDAHGKVVAASVPFVPESPSGTVEVPFTLDASSLAGKDVVAFEVVMVAEDESVVATHEDISDGGQTVTVNEPPTTPPSKKALPKTGDLALPVGALVTAASLSLGCAAFMRWRDRRGC